MNERGQEVLWFAPVVMLAILAGAALLIAGGPRIGGAPADVHYALRDLLAGDGQPIADKLASAPLTVTLAVTSIPLPGVVPTVPMIAILAPTPVLTSEVPCVAFRFAGAASIQEGRVSFGRLNLVTDTDPQGKSDPLASWKLMQFASFSLSIPAGKAGGSVRSSPVITIPISQTVDMVITDPFTEEMLFSARWQVQQIELVGHNASINASLRINRKDIRVNNVIESPTLAALTTIPAGVLVMRLKFTEDIAPALGRAEPVYALMSGTVSADRCLR